MAKILYLSEIIKFAIEKEQESFALYEKLSQQVSNPEIKDLCETLMEQEKQHEIFYTEILSSTSPEQSPKIQEDDEYFAYVQELISASRKISPFTELDFNDLTAIFDYAIGKEKDSILFYVGLKNYTLTDLHDQIDTIIKEEARHIAMLLKLKNAPQ